MGEYLTILRKQDFMSIIRFRQIEAGINFFSRFKNDILNFEIRQIVAEFNNLASLNKVTVH